MISIGVVTEQLIECEVHLPNGGGRISPGGIGNNGGGGMNGRFIGGGPMNGGGRNGGGGKPMIGDPGVSK